MDLLNILTSTPLSTAVATIIAIGCLVGYFFFVIPALKERDDLKTKLDARDKEEESRILKRTAEITNKLDAIIKILDESSGLAALSLDISSIKKDVLKVSQMGSGSKARGEELERLLSEVRNTMQSTQMTLHSVSDKQSQIIGALLGMNRLQDNRNIGL